MSQASCTCKNQFLYGLLIDTVISSDYTCSLEWWGGCWTVRRSDHVLTWGAVSVFAWTDWGMPWATLFGDPLSGPIIDSEISRSGSRSAVHLTAMFGEQEIAMCTNEYASSVAVRSFVYYCYDLTHTGLEAHPNFRTMYRHSGFFGYKPVGVGRWPSTIFCCRD